MEVQETGKTERLFKVCRNAARRPVRLLIRILAGKCRGLNDFLFPFHACKPAARLSASNALLLFFPFHALTL